MTPHIKTPTLIKSAGNKPKLIKEFIGLATTGTADISIARMKSPPGWEEPAQTPEFDEYTYVLKGSVCVNTLGKTFSVRENEVFIAKKGIQVQYSTPTADGAEYIAVCLPAFSADTVNREDI
jgi:quercetin dioxygenase-like cupin family protein